MKKWTICFFCFCFLGCQVEPGVRKISRPDKNKQIVSPPVNGIYNPTVDILFVIDNSSSMQLYQNLLADNISLFVGRFFGANVVDYHIGVTTSSSLASNSIHPFYAFGNNGNFLGGISGADGIGYSYVNRDISDGDLLLANIIKNVGIKGNAIERFLNIPELTFLEDSGGFLRSEAHLAIFVITDTDDQSDVFPQEAYQYLLDLKEGDHKKLHYAAALVIEQRDGCKIDPMIGPHQRAPSDFKLMRMVKLFGGNGHVFDLCNSDYGKELADIAQSIVYSVLTIELDDLPDINSMRVCYRQGSLREGKFCETGHEIANGSDGWIYDVGRNAIHLSADIVLESQLNGKFDIQYIPIYSPDSEE